jgi:hypothetical protein
MYTDGGAKKYEVKADFDKGKITSLHRGVCTGSAANGVDSWSVSDGKTLEFWMAGSKLQTPKPSDFGSKDKFLLTGNVTLKAAKDEADAADVQISGVTISKSGKLSGNKVTVVLPKWGAYEGSLTEGKRSGSGTFTYPPGHMENGINYGGTTVTGEWKDDKVTGMEVKMKVCKNGHEQPMRTLKLDPANGKPKAGGACCAAPLPTELVANVPPTVAVPYANEGGIPLPFSKKIDRKPIEVTAPWEGKIKF